MSLTIGVDIGGTKIAAGLVSEDGKIVESARHETPATEAAEIAPMVAELVERLRGNHKILGIGIGAAGFIDAARQTVLFAPNIDWIDEPLAAQVRDRVGLPVIVENDANAAAWGEFRFGAGEDTDDLLLVTVGTGIGGGIVHDGQLYRGGFGVAAEIGHMRVVREGILCGCGQLGCWEKYASGSALVREARELVTADDPRAAALAASVGGDPTLIDGPMVTKLAQQGDALAIDLLTDVGHWLGEGIATLCTILDPSVVAIGGGVAAAGELILAPIQESFGQYLSAHDHRPIASLRLAALGNQAGLIGAADLARSAPAGSAPDSTRASGNS
ncbi:MAG: ROK family glucokinase [Kineosporiaceae bacterium]|nr:ROK family glucokinase [Aeromicrobium sp.]